MRKQWYALHVQTDKEQDVRRQLDEKEITSLLPIENRLIRSGGVWKEREYILFPGYLFLFIHYTFEIHHLLKSIPYTVRLLPKEKPTPLEENEVAWLLEIGDIVTDISTVDFSSAEPTILSGPLLQLKSYIVKFDRHGRRVHLKIPILGEIKPITLSFIPV